MNVKQLKKKLEKLDDKMPVIFCDDGIYKHMRGDADKLMRDPTQAGYALRRACYRIAESNDPEDKMIDAFLMYADD